MADGPSDAVKEDDFDRFCRKTKIVHEIMYRLERISKLCTEERSRHLEEDFNRRMDRTNLIIFMLLLGSVGIGVLVAGAITMQHMRDALHIVRALQHEIDYLRMELTAVGGSQ